MNRLPIRVVVADDEPLVRRGIREILEEAAGVEVVAEARDGVEAAAAIERERPDLAFLDVRMPGLDGFAALERVRGPLPWVVFVTAFDEYALRAFQSHAVDYLMKPFDRERVERALEKARTLVRGERARMLEERLRGLLADVRPAAAGPDRVAVRIGDRVVLVEADGIDYVTAEGNYVRIVAGERRHLARTTMKEMEEDLGPRGFVRIHRSTLVNFGRVREIVRSAGEAAEVVLADGTRLRASESGRRRIERLLGEAPGDG